MPKTRSIPKDTVGGRLRAARQRRKLTLADVGRQCGVTPQAVAQWEYNEAEPGVDTLCVLSKLLEVKLGEVLGLQNHSLGDLAERLEQVTALMPRAQGVIVDTEKRTRAPHRGFYVVELKEGEAAPIVARVVWPSKL